MDCLYGSPLGVPPSGVSLFRVSQTGASLLPQFSDALHELIFVLQPLMQLPLIGSKRVKVACVFLCYIMFWLPFVGDLDLPDTLCIIEGSAL